MAAKEKYLLIAINSKVSMDFQVQQLVLTLSTRKIKPQREADGIFEERKINVNKVTMFPSTWWNKGHIDSQPKQKIIKIS